jgi:hypothetical protein
MVPERDVARLLRSKNMNKRAELVRLGAFAIDAILPSVLATIKDE